MPGTEGEQRRPVQPDGSSSHTEAQTTTPEPQVNEVKKICIYSLVSKTLVAVPRVYDIHVFYT